MSLPNRISFVFTFVFFFASVSAANAQPALNKALDYDGDGKVDMAVFRPRGNEWLAYKSGGGGFIGPQIGDIALDTPTPGDYDGDGKGEVAVWREANGTFYYLQSSNNAFVSKQFGQIGDEPMARDYDGDGLTDCAVIRRDGNTMFWFIWKSSNNSVTGYQYGMSTDHPAPGDYDGDGIYDFAVQRKLFIGGPFVIYIYRSRLGAMTVEVTEFANADSSFVPGDYDGDGITDLAFTRKEFLTDEIKWKIRRSLDGVIEVHTFGTQMQRAMPAQGDYDGDGKTDLAMWRASDYKFSIKQSLNGQVVEWQWGEMGDFPVAGYDTH